MLHTFDFSVKFLNSIYLTTHWQLSSAATIGLSDQSMARISSACFLVFFASVTTTKKIIVSNFIYSLKMISVPGDELENIHI